MADLDHEPRGGGDSALPPRITIRDVGPRDGLQVEAPVAVEDRIRLVRGLVRAGLREIEVGSFVSPKAVPAMAQAAAVFAGTEGIPGLVRAALVPNARGAADAVAAGADELTSIISASPTYNLRNVRMTTDESLAQVVPIAAAAHAAGIGLDVVISCSFGSPYEGEIDPAAVANLAAACRANGADRITLADTTGMATPRGIHEVIDRTGPDVGIHLHETRGTGLVCCYAAMQRGVTRFDTSVGGLGGSPFAAGAAGNVATEDLVSLVEDLGVDTGVDLVALLDVCRDLAALVDHPLPSAVSSSGPRITPDAAILSDGGHASAPLSNPTA
ncbi:MAG: hydroxymethylglutaryl-CoA lyase [Patulibacter sp.]|nr:hydroxymethylglutaryl-CoA lyase [Patulibacter sp.]